MTPAGVTILLIRQAERLHTLAERCRAGREYMLADELAEIRGEILDAVDALNRGEAKAREGDTRG